MAEETGTLREEAPPNHDIIVVGTSAGGVEALLALVGALPRDLPAALFAVLHTTPSSPMALADILNTAGTLYCAYAQSEELIQYGRVYLAAPDYHLLVQPGKVQVVHGPRENRHRPAIDPLFRSAAAAYGPRVVGVILTGNLNDGTAGLIAIKRCGGLAIVQDPQETLFSGMARSALQFAEVDYRLRLAEIPGLLIDLARTPVQKASYTVPEVVKVENESTQNALMDPGRLERVGERSILSCPECGGTLFELEDDQLVRYRCMVGHAYTSQVLGEEQAGQIEGALWVALRTLDNYIALRRHMLENAQRRHMARTADNLQEELDEASRHAEVIRGILRDNKSYPNVGTANLANTVP